MHQSFLDHAGRRYLKVALALCAASIALYAWHDPRSPPNGGTWLVYTLGGIGAALILWMAALGIRKRSYSSALGTVRGWVSAHVYLGLALIVVATLTPDHSMPSTAVLVKGAIGSTRAAAFDLSAACSGFAYAYAVAHGFITAGLGQRALVIGAETLSRSVDWSDRSINEEFGDRKFSEIWV